MNAYLILGYTLILFQAVSTVSDKRYRALIQDTNNDNRFRTAIRLVKSEKHVHNMEHALNVILETMEQTSKFAILELLYNINAHDLQLAAILANQKSARLSKISEMIRNNDTLDLLEYLQAHDGYYPRFIKEILVNTYQSDSNNFDAVYDFLLQCVYPINKNSLQGISVFLDILKSLNHLKNRQTMQLAMRLKVLEPLLKLRGEYNSAEFQVVLNKLPQNLREILWNVVFIKIKNDESSLYVANEVWDENRRRVFNSRPERLPHIESQQWQLDIWEEKEYTFLIKSISEDAYLYASADTEFKYWKNDRNSETDMVLTWVGGEKFRYGVWELIPLDDDFTTFDIRNVYYDMYLKGGYLQPEND